MYFHWASLVPLGLVLAFSIVARSRFAARPTGPLRFLSSHWSVLIFSVLVALVYWFLRGEWEPFALAIGAISLLRGAGSGRRLLPQRILDGPAIPAVLGLLTAAVMVWAWAAPRAAEFHDESAYNLQAEIFAGGRWTTPPPPKPEFFEQMHVLVDPARAAKYPPGHSLLLAPGVRAGIREAIPILLSALSGALVFALTRRVTNSYVALLTWLVWVAAPGGLKFRSSYFSEVTTALLWLAGWWALLRWRETGKRAWLAALAACVGWGAITRPLTMLVFAVPVGLVVLRDVSRNRRWPDFALAVLLGAGLLLLIPLWSWKTTGDWKTTPLALYTRTYLPFDKPGFTLDTSPPLRPLPPDIESVYRFFLEVGRQHTVANLGEILGDRSRAVREDLWEGWRRPLLLFALAGLFFVPREAAFALGSSILLLLAYLCYAHSSNWSIYYLETHPVLACLTGLGIWGILGLLTAPRGPAGAASPGPVAAVLALSLALALAIFSVPDVRRFRASKQRDLAAQVRFGERVAAVPAPALVFVRYSWHHDFHRSLIENPADLARAHAWVVYDRGSENSRLARLAPNRKAYLYDEATDTLAPLPAESLAISRH